MRFLPMLLSATTFAAAPPGTYEHASLPAGSDGWTPSVSAPGGFVSASDETRSGGGLRIGFWYRNPFAPGDTGDWAYAAPPGTRIAGWSAERELTGLADGDWQAIVSAVEGSRQQPLFSLVPATNRPWSRIAVSGLHADRIVARLTCGGPHVCRHSGDSAQLGIRNAVAVLRDDVAPVAQPPRGDLAELRTLKGVARLSAAATDIGGGLLRTLVVVDGAEVSSTPVPGGPACRDVDPGPARTFAARVPCPLGATVSASLDTRGLRDGTHVIEVLLEDVAGNRTTVFGPSTRDVANHPAARPPVAVATPPRPAPVPAVAAQRPLQIRAWIPLHGRRARGVTLRHGAGVAIRGTARDVAGRPAGGEVLTVLTRVGHGRWHSAGLTRARADGGFAASLGGGPSRRVLVTAAGARSGALSVRVRTGVRFSVAARGRWISVRGALRGGRVPEAGALVSIQGRRAHRWITLTTLRTDAAGRFRGRVAAGGADRIRAAVRRQPGYPFAAGVSPSRAPRTAVRTSR